VIVDLPGAITFGQTFGTARSVAEVRAIHTIGVPRPRCGYARASEATDGVNFTRTFPVRLPCCWLPGRESPLAG
jgi:hypothetical protein